MQSITEVRAFPGRGLEGDRYFAGTGFYSKKSSYGGREVTLIRLCEPCKRLDDLTRPGVMSRLVVTKPTIEVFGNKENDEKILRVELVGAAVFVVIGIALIALAPAKQSVERTTVGALARS